MQIQLHAILPYPEFFAEDARKEGIYVTIPTCNGPAVWTLLFDTEAMPNATRLWVWLWTLPRRRGILPLPWSFVMKHRAEVTKVTASWLYQGLDCEKEIVQCKNVKLRSCRQPALPQSHPGLLCSAFLMVDMTLQGQWHASQVESQPPCSSSFPSWKPPEFCQTRLCHCWIIKMTRLQTSTAKVAAE